MFLLPPGNKALKSAVESPNICGTQEACLQNTSRKKNHGDLFIGYY